MSEKKKLNVVFIHPDLGIGGAERLVVDAALGLQNKGHSVSITTSHHDSTHCFDETKDGTLNVILYKPPFFLPRSIHGKLHILLAHLRQLHLTWHLLRADGTADVFVVDQLSTCIPILRLLSSKRVVFYCHFPDKLLATGEAINEDGDSAPPKPLHNNASLLKRLYRLPMDFLEEKTTANADIILVNSLFTSRIFKRHFPSIKLDKDGKTLGNRQDIVQGGPRVIYPGINLAAYEVVHSADEPREVTLLRSDRPTFISLNRFEAKKNVALALKAFALFTQRVSQSSKPSHLRQARLVITGGYDPRVRDNVDNLNALLKTAYELKLSWCLFPVVNEGKGAPSIPDGLSPQSPLETAQVVFLPNFTTSQRSLLLTSSSTLALLYTPTGEHFGIVPVEAMACGLPVLACRSGGPKESVVDDEPESPRELGDWSVLELSNTEKSSSKTGWLRPPSSEAWAEALYAIAMLSPSARYALSVRAKSRARDMFSLESMAAGMESAVKDAYSQGPVKRGTIISSEVITWVYIFLVAISIFTLGATYTIAWTAVVLGGTTLLGF